MIEFIKEKKNFIIIVGIIIILIIYYFLNFNTNTEENFTKGDMLQVVEDTDDDIDQENDEDVIVVHIIGGVKKPGIVKLKEDSRIEDAIEAAGGLTKDADITNVNLAYLLEDGVKVRIPTIDDKVKDNEEQTYITEDSGKNIILENNTEDSSNTIVNINKADQSELETLPGIGPSLATKIIEYRESNGKFLKKDDIKNVTGIGDSKYGSIKDFITVK